MSSFLLLAAYAAGILIGDNASPFTSFSLVIPSSLLLLWFFFRERERLSFLLLCGLTLCLGIALYDLNRSPRMSSDHLLAFTEQEEVIIDGRILATMARSQSGYSIDVQSTRLVEKSKEFPVHGRLRLYVETGENAWNPGDDIRFSSKLKAPRPFGTPGEFDLGRQLALHEIFVTAFVPGSDDILLLRPATARQRSLIERGRTATARFITAQTTSTYGPLVKALSIGEMGGLPPEIRDLLARGGVSHLFAISGLQLTLLGLALYALGLTLYRRSTRLLLAAPPARILPILIAPILVLYLLWTGVGVSIQRALFMALAGSFLFMVRRKTDGMHILGFSAFVILLCQPLALFTPSFQLSFAALAGILCGNKIWSPALAGRSKAIQYLATLFFSSLAATLATLPLVIYHFHLIAPSGVLNNLFAIPILNWVALPLAVFGSILWPFTPKIAVILLAGCEAAIAATLKIVAAVIALPGLSGWTFYPSLSIFAGLSLLTIALFTPRKNFLPRRIMIGTAILFFLWEMRPQPELCVTALSVGQGESLLISVDKANYLVDGGGLCGDRLDTGRQLVAPALGRFGVHQLDGVILTHTHPDHAKGLLSILTDIPCKRLIVGAALEKDNPLLAVIRGQQIPIEVAPPGWSNFFSGASAQLFLFSPSTVGTGDENDRSLVIYARSREQGALLTGDLGEEGVQQLLANPPPGPVTLFKLPHHGSQRSLPAPLIDLLHPRTAFVSAGYRNRFGFPHSLIVSYLDRKGIPLFRTDLDGTLRFIATEGDWRTEKPQSGFLIDTSVATLLLNSGLSTPERSRPE